MMFLPLRRAQMNVWPVSNCSNRTLAGNYHHCYTARYCHLVTCVYTTYGTYNNISALLLELCFLNNLLKFTCINIALILTHILCYWGTIIYRIYNRLIARMLRHNRQLFIIHIQQLLQIF